jgi:hypothetical protein
MTQFVKTYPDFLTTDNFKFSKAESTLKSNHRRFTITKKHRIWVLSQYRVWSVDGLCVTITFSIKKPRLNNQVIESNLMFDICIQAKGETLNLPRNQFNLKEILK